MAIEKELLDRLLVDYNYTKPEDLIGENGLLKQLTKALFERALQAEMTVHLGHERHGSITVKGGNARNGNSTKTIKGDFGKMCQSALKIDPPSASKIDPPQAVFFSY